MTTIIKVLVILSLLLVGCSSPISGTVVGKRYDPQNMTLIPITITHCNTVGKTVVCTPSIIFMPMNDDEDFYLIIKDYEGKDHEREVTKEYYDSAREGDKYADPK